MLAWQALLWAGGEASSFWLALAWGSALQLKQVQARLHPADSCRSMLGVMTLNAVYIIALLVGVFLYWGRGLSSVRVVRP